jgi:hypothetical protein
MLTLHFQHIHLIIHLFLAEMLQAHPAAGSNQCLKLQGRSFGWLVSVAGRWVGKENHKKILVWITSLGFKFKFWIS